MNFANSQVIGIDAGKDWFHVVVMNSRGQQIDRRKLRREALLEYVAQQERCLIAMESCGGTQFLATKMQALGHEVRLVPAQFAAPFRKSNKNDFNGAEAIAEAAVRGHMRFSRVKSVEELDLQALHRARDRLIRERTGQINQVRERFSWKMESRSLKVRRSFSIVCQRSCTTLTVACLASCYVCWKF
jgi:transposase